MRSIVVCLDGHGIADEGITTRASPLRIQLPVNSILRSVLSRFVPAIGHEGILFVTKLELCQLNETAIIQSQLVVLICSANLVLVAEETLSVVILSLNKTIGSEVGKL